MAGKSASSPKYDFCTEYPSHLVPHDCFLPLDAGSRVAVWAPSRPRLQLVRSQFFYPPALQCPLSTTVLAQWVPPGRSILLVGVTLSVLGAFNIFHDLQVTSLLPALPAC